LGLVRLKSLRHISKGGIDRLRFSGDPSLTEWACVDGASVGHMLFQMLSSGKTLSTKVTVKRPLAQVGFQVPSQGAGFPEGLGALPEGLGALGALVESLGIGYGECAPECVVKLSSGIQVLLVGPCLRPGRHHTL